jgi:hypothetical protein
MAKKEIDEIQEIAGRAAEWPQQAQEELVESAINIEARYQGVYIATKEDRTALKQSAEDMRHDRFASDADVRKVFHRFNRA